VPEAGKISFKRIGLMVTAVVLPAAGFLYWTVNYGSDNLRRAVGEYIGGAGTLLYFGMAYLFAFLQRLPEWVILIAWGVIAFIVVALLTYRTLFKRESQNNMTEAEDTPSQRGG